MATRSQVLRLIRFLRLVTVLAAVSTVVACTNGGQGSRADKVDPAASPAPSSTGTAPSSGVAPASSGSAPSSAGAEASVGNGLPVLPDLAAPDEPATTWTEQLQADLANTGTPTLTQAIDMFDMSMADIPGASTSALPVGDGFSATVAMAAIQTYRDQLTAAQLAVVDSFDGTVISASQYRGGSFVPVTTGSANTGVDTTRPSTAQSSPTQSSPTQSSPTQSSPTASTGSTAPGPSAPTSSSAPATSTTGTAAWIRPLHRIVSAEPAVAKMHLDAPTQSAAFVHDSELLNETLLDWNAREPDLIQLPKSFGLAVSPKQPKDNSEMDTRPSKTIPGGCLITMYPVFTGGHYGDALTKYIFAHELFHCIQFSWANGLGGPAWLIEGSAEFAALNLYRSTLQPIDTESFQGWFTNTGLGLGQEPRGRGYDDWPLFEAFKQTYATDPFPYIERMVKAGGNTANILKAGSFDNPIFANLWTSTSLRSTTFTDASFRLNWPGVQPGYGKKDTGVDLGARGLGTYHVKGKGNYVHQQYQVELPGVGMVGVVPTGGPMLTHADAGTVGVGEGQQKWFCTDPGKCVCPDGTRSTVQLTPLTPPMIFSFATQQRASSADVVDRKWDPSTYCTPDNDTPEAGPVGTSNGDPHITTFNGLTYNFMTYGEFVSARDPQGGFTVQERHQEAGFGTAVSAVAIGDGTHRITLTVAAVKPEAAITVRADGVVTSETTFTAGGLSVSSQSEPATWTVSFPDGSAVEAEWNDGFFVTVEPSAARAPRIVGLLGTPGSTFLDDLAMPDGSRAVPANGYLAFAQAWWVTDATTLFDYDHGQNTETFRVVPPAVPVTAPPAATVAVCEQGLGPAATVAEYDACAYDLTSLNLSPPDQTSIVTAYQQVVAQRAADITTTPTAPNAPQITVGQTATPPSSAAPAAGGTGTSAPPGSTLTLQGTFAQLTDGMVNDKISGTMHLVAGTVLLARVQCPSDPAFQLYFSATATTGGAVGTALCGTSWKAAGYNSGPNSESHPGESYILINKTDTYTVVAADISMFERKPGPLSVSVSLVADPAPIVVASTALPAAGATASFSSTADTMVVEVVPGSAGGTWSVSGGDKVCTQVFYIAGPLGSSDKTPDDLGPLCWHHTKISIGPFSGMLPIVIFDRDGSPVTITVTRDPPG